MENKEVDYQVIHIGKMVYDEIPNCKYEYEAIRKICNKIGLKEITVSKYYLCYLCYKKGVDDTKPKITTKGFDYYKSKNNTGEWFDISDVMSEQDLIDSIKECVEIDKIALDSLNEIYENHFELCSKLNELMDNIPDKIRDEIWDLVYKHFEP